MRPAIVFPAEQQLLVSKRISSFTSALARVVLDHELLVDRQREVFTGWVTQKAALTFFGVELEPWQGAAAFLAFKVLEDDREFAGFVRERDLIAGFDFEAGDVDFLAVDANVVVSDELARLTARLSAHRC